MFKNGMLAVAAAVTLLMPALASAQSSPLSSTLLNVLLSDVFLQPTPPNSPFPNHTAHFVPLSTSGTLNEGFELSDIAVPVALNSTIVSQLSTVPLGSSSGGFTWTFDPALGTFNRASESFGPAFGERAQTSGRGKFDFGMNYLHTSFNSIQGKDLSNGDVRVYLQHEQTTPVLFFEGDVMQEALQLDLKTDTFAFFANYGVTNRLDVGVVVPVLRVSLQANMTATVERLATATFNPPIHVFPNGTTQNTYSGGGTAKGIGDIVVRAKYNVLKRDALGVAGGLDLRLPTGDANNLLGTGVTETRVYVILSDAVGRFTPHVNLGYTFASKQDSNNLYLAQLPNELGYTFGLDAAVTPRVTFAADVLGRSLRDTAQLVDANHVFSYFNQNGVPGSQTFDTFEVVQGNQNLALASVGAKINVWGNLLLSAQVLFPVTSNGLHARPAPVIGVDYAF
jgi:hypothetical protein